MSGRFAETKTEVNNKKAKEMKQEYAKQNLGMNKVSMCQIPKNFFWRKVVQIRNLREKLSGFDD